MADVAGRKRSKPLYILTTPERFDQVRATAAERGVSITFLVEEAIDLVLGLQLDPPQPSLTKRLEAIEARIEQLFQRTDRIA